ncbi:MAG: PorV/PorQ family protein [Gemmatimonadaceae bacterium]
MSTLALAAVLGLLAAATAPVQAGAQGADGQGASFLLLPVGARALSLGGAASSMADGSESLFWNPAAAARASASEVAVHHSQTVAATNDALAVIVPWRRRIVLGLSAMLVDLGSQDVVPPEGGPPIGSLLARDVVVAGSAAVPIGGRVDVGATVKLLQVRVDCTGQCASVPVSASTATAFDLGARFRVPGSVPFSVGVLVRNLGPKLSLRDRAEKDALPTRWQAGVAYEVLQVARYAPDVQLRLAADLGSDMDYDAAGVRVGGEAVWQQRVALRGGYVFRDRAGATAQASGPTVGLGVTAGRFVVDLAREFQGLSVDAGEPPTHLSLRFRF